MLNVSQNSLMAHVAVWLCDRCADKFGSFYALRRHQNRQHAEEANQGVRWVQVTPMLEEPVIHFFSDMPHLGLAEEVPLEDIPVEPLPGVDYGTFDEEAFQEGLMRAAYEPPVMTDEEAVRYIETLCRETTDEQPDEPEEAQEEHFESGLPDPAEVWFHQSSPSSGSPRRENARWSLPPSVEENLEYRMHGVVALLHHPSAQGSFEEFRAETASRWPDAPEWMIRAAFFGYRNAE